MSSVSEWSLDEPGTTDADSPRPWQSEINPWHGDAESACASSNGHAIFSDGSEDDAPLAELQQGSKDVDDRDPAPPSLAEEDVHDLGNAEHFAAQHADALRYVPAWGGWLSWDARRWAEDDTLEHIRAAKATVRELARELTREAFAAADPKQRKDLLQRAARLQSEQKLRAMVKLAAADERLVVRPVNLDQDPWLLNTQTGVVDLRTGELRPHRGEDNLTMITGGGYRADAQAPRWMAHLARCLRDPALRAFFQRFAGLSAIGLSLEHLLAILFGAGANGKSATRNALADTLGDYAYQSTLDLLIQSGRSPGQATPELADLRGRRLVNVSESPQDGRLASERVKWITGGEPITARRLHANPFTFEPSHTIWLSTNHRPRIADDGDAIWRRVLLIPFEVTIPEDERDTRLREKLAAERDGILRWIVDGARAYLRDGLNPPAAVTAATADYRDAENVFGAFLSECAIVGEPDASVQASDLLRAYQTWAAVSGAPNLSGNALAEKLETRGFERRRVKTGTRWYGLRLHAEGTLDG